MIYLSFTNWKEKVREAEFRAELLENEIDLLKSINSSLVKALNKHSETFTDANGRLRYKMSGQYAPKRNEPGNH